MYGKARYLFNKSPKFKVSTAKTFGLREGQSQMTVFDYPLNWGNFWTSEISECHFLVYQIILDFFGRFPGVLDDL